VVDFKESDWDRMIDINLKGVLRFTQTVARHMVEQKSGKIINMASESGKTAKPLFTVYGTTKFAVVGLTQGLAQELAPYGINVNAVCPGIVNTPMWHGLDRALAKLQGLREGQALEKRRGAIPLGRLEEPEDVAGVVAFLASADADYMTGQSVNVTGGREFH
jgi:NAD(P)-dependent dehydrogenase (short-subunit alcohol dehydrogenase family)